MEGKPEKSDGGSRYTSPVELAKSIAETLACRFLAEGGIVQDPGFAGFERHELRARAFTAATLSLVESWRLPCGVDSHDAARKLLESIWRALDPPLWAGSASASAFIAAFSLEAALALGARIPDRVSETIRLQARTVHVPNQEAINAYGILLYHRATGSPWALEAAARKVEALRRLAGRGLLREPWGDAPAYNGVASWILSLMEDDLPQAGILSSQLARLLAGLAAWEGPPSLPGRSSYFSFTVPSLAAAYAAESRRGLEWLSTVAVRLVSFFASNYMRDDPLPAKNLLGKTLIREYGVREVYAAWAARALLDAAVQPSGEPPSSGVSATCEYVSSWRPGSVSSASVRGYAFFDNYSPPCTLSLALKDSQMLALPITTCLSSSETTPMAYVNGVAAAPHRWSWGWTAGGESYECRAYVAGDGWSVARILTGVPAGVAIVDTAGSDRVNTIVYIRDLEGVEIRPKPLRRWRVETQAGISWALLLPGGSALISWGDSPPAPTKPRLRVMALKARLHRLAFTARYSAYIRMGRVKV